MHAQPFPFQDAAAQLGYPNGLNPQAVESMSPDLLAAVRQQMCNMVDAANFVAGFNLPPNMTMQTISPNMGGNSGNISNPKAGSPAAMHQLNNNKNGGGGEPSNMLQMPRLDSPALQNLPSELSLVQGLQNLSPNDELDFGKNDKRLRKSLDEELLLDEQQKALNNNRLSITKMNSPKSGSKTSPSMESLEPAVNLAISSHTLDMSYKSRNSSDGSVNGEDYSRSYRNAANSLAGYSHMKSTSPIKVEPLTDCRE